MAYRIAPKLHDHNARAVCADVCLCLVASGLCSHLGDNFDELGELIVTSHGHLMKRTDSWQGRKPSHTSAFSAAKSIIKSGTACDGSIGSCGRSRVSKSNDQDLWMSLGEGA